MEDRRNFIYVRIELLRSEKNFFDDLEGKDFERLVASIRKNGIYEPLGVSENEDGTFTIRSGHQRYRAAQLAGRKEAPCYIEDKNLIDAAFDTDICRRHLKEEEQEKAEATKEELAKEEKAMLREIIVPKLIPELVELYDIGKLSVNDASSIARNVPKEVQKTIAASLVNTSSHLPLDQSTVASKEVEPVVIVPPEYEEEMKSLQHKLEKIKAEGREMKDTLFEKEKLVKEIRQKASEQKEALLEKIETLEAAKQKAGEEARKEFEKDQEEYRLRLVSMSHEVQVKEREIEALKEKIITAENKESGYQAEIKGQKLVRAQIEQAHKAELERLSRPDLIAKKLDYLAENLEALIDQFKSLGKVKSMKAVVAKYGLQKKVKNIINLGEEMGKCLTEGEPA
ncbi:MAG: ParB N-terminal domain-containing protein [Candidatus Tectomicrobia bacterium]|uniref:ParB N-terminal domain-containing protein n=1 Tax=Tectimicrobiota bacterium TaxID=2528274 RepID=A0A933LQ42_UNCTE|nr:ParB N-terminal domain-containing protein [Candidatus Tectomicrobia bacterium]